MKMKPSDDRLAEFRRRYDAFVLAVRTVRRAQRAAEDYLDELLVELQVPAGHSVDVHGDGVIKPQEDCQPAPKV